MGAADKVPRLMPRIRRRLKVELADHPVLTIDVSAGGFCIETLRMLPPQTLVAGKIWIGERFYEFTGRVAWARAGIPSINMRGRLGIRFTGIDNDFFRDLAASWSNAEVLGPPTLPKRGR